MQKSAAMKGRRFVPNHVLVRTMLWAVGLWAVGAPVVSAAEPKCFPREGHCVAVKVGDQATVPLTKKTKKALKKLEEISHYVDDTRYELPEPVRGEIEVVAAQAQGAGAFLGTGGAVDVQIIPLQEVEVETRRGLKTDATVRTGGRATVGEARFLTDNRLPPGMYLLRVKLRGSENWDRQTIFFTVESPPAE